LQLDHVVVAVSHLATAATDFEHRYGLQSVEGGRHPGWGTANRIVPLGDAYLELVAVVDASEAAVSSFGRVVAAALAGRDERLLGWAVRTDELDAIAGRLRLDVQAKSRARTDGSELCWRLAGVEQAFAEPCLPFFIEWADDAELPGRSAPAAGALEWLELEGDPERLAGWLGEHSLPVSVTGGSPAVRRVVVEARGCRVSVVAD
jgi:hypothetical protein